MTQFVLKVQICKMLNEPDEPVNNDFITIPIDSTYVNPPYCFDWDANALNSLDLLIRRNWHDIGLAGNPPPFNGMATNVKI